MKNQQEASDILRDFVVANLEFFVLRTKDRRKWSPFIRQKGIHIHVWMYLCECMQCVKYHMYFLFPVFGYPLYAVVKREGTNSGIPTIIEKTTKFILQSMQIVVVVVVVVVSVSVVHVIRINYSFSINR